MMLRLGCRSPSSGAPRLCGISGGLCTVNFKSIVISTAVWAVVVGHARPGFFSLVLRDDDIAQSVRPGMRSARRREKGGRWQGKGNGKDAGGKGTSGWRPGCHSSPLSQFCKEQEKIDCLSLSPTQGGKTLLSLTRLCMTHKASPQAKQTSYHTCILCLSFLVRVIYRLHQ